MAHIFRWYCTIHGDDCDHDAKRRHIFRLIKKGG